MSVVKRTHTNANIAPAIWTLREQVNEAYPNRDKASDGIWPSAAHTKASPNSDHEAGNAIDITANLGSGQSVQTLYDRIKASGDGRVSYMIYNRRIWSPGTGERVYTGGPNPHTSHMHLSVLESQRGDARDWAVKEETVTERMFKVYAIEVTMRPEGQRERDIRRDLEAVCKTHGLQLREARTTNDDNTRRDIPARYTDMYRVL